MGGAHVRGQTAGVVKTARTTTYGDFVLGRDVGMYGRIARVLAGGWLVLAGVGQVAGDGFRIGEAAALAGYLAVLTVLYTAAMYALGERVLARLNPWTGTTLLLAPVVTLVVVDATAGLPPALPAAAYIYVGLSNVLIGIAGYGGCEIVGLPVLVLRRRYTVYCALNALDAAERPLTRATTRTVRLVAGVPLLLGGVYYFLAQSLLALLGAQVPFDQRWPVLAFLPAVVLLTHAAWLGVRRTGWSAADAVTRSFAAGAAGLAATAAGILVFGNILFAYAVLTVAIFAAGIVAAVRQATAD